MKNHINKFSPDQSLQDGVSSVGHYTGVSLNLSSESCNIPEKQYHVIMFVLVTTGLSPGHPLPPVVPFLVSNNNPTLFYCRLARESVRRVPL